MSGDPTNPATRAPRRPAPVTVRYGGRSWRLSGGGRADLRSRVSTWIIQLATDPPDLRVSRHAGTLRCLADTVLISNVSSRGVLTLGAEGAVTREIAPGRGHHLRAAPGVHRWPSSVTTVRPTSSRSMPAASRRPGRAPGRPARGAATVLTTPYDLTPSQRRVLDRPVRTDAGAGGRGVGAAERPPDRPGAGPAAELRPQRAEGDPRAADGPRRARAGQRGSTETRARTSGSRWLNGPSATEWPTSPSSDEAAA